MWIFLFCMDLLIPLTMIGFGRHFCRSAPKSINALYGYRTSRSMKNEETWQFAHRHIGTVWQIGGWILLGLSVVVLLLFLGQPSEQMSKAGGIVCGVQAVLLVLSVIPTEWALRKRFDADGHRRTGS